MIPRDFNMIFWNLGKSFCTLLNTGNRKREELKKAVEEKRVQRIKEIEAAKKAKEEKKKQ